MIRVDSLVKTYDSGTQALRGVSLHVQEGDIYAFIGPNGAGKTTTIRILATLLEPTAGLASIAGEDVSRYPERVRRLIGYMPDEFGVYPGLRIWEYLDFFAAAYRMPKAARRRAVDDVMALTDLAPLREKMVETLSKGMRQRLCLAKTLVHDPKVLILDEPAAGLDPRARIEFRALLKTLSGMGKTIFISSHILTELREFCNACCIIERGRILACGSIDGIAEQLMPARVIVVRLLSRAGEAAELLAAHPGIASAAAEGNTVRAEFRGAEGDMPGLMRMLVEKGLPVIGLEEKERDMEALFMRITKGELA
ncbi:MAG TPA: ABC transporter ATP-binding protein [Planctomycetota bacterium]|nr:ABC transporter ATP-binding protein [Planctomycetota bacterium]